MTRYHSLLEIPSDASEAQIKSAYLAMVKVWHPDRFTGDPALQKKAEEKLRQINFAYEELLKPSSSVSRHSSFVPHPSPIVPLRTSRSIWFVFAGLAMGAAIILYVGIKSSANQQATLDPKVLTQESAPVSRGVMNRYWLQSVSGKQFYVIEGPRVPLDWEVDALVETYNGQTPKGKQSLGNFSISQTSKPGDSNPMPLNYRIKDEAEK